MTLIVQKFGGTSVADPQKILAAARKAVRAHQEGHQVVMVVSAMGHNTDHLIELASQVAEAPPAREMDMLLSTGEQVSVALMAMAIQAMGYRAISFTGAQIGIKTDSTHTKARIRSISTDRMRKALADGNIVIAAGFQGIDEDFNITTLGRGGSDTTAVALAAVLGADACEIYTDVDGVYTTDPRILPEARLVRRVSYDEMLELASLGAGVMHNRSIEFAKKFNVPVHVRSSFSDVLGTLIVAQPEATNMPVGGAALVKTEARVTISGVPDCPGSSLAIFSKLAAAAISVDMIVQNVGDNGLADISFTVPRDELTAALQALNQAASELKATHVSHDEDVAKVSVVGLGMAKQTGVANDFFAALARAEVNIQMITTSEIKISVLVSKSEGLPALRAVHQAFGLDKAPAGAPTEIDLSQVRHGKSSAVEIVEELRAMEALAIESVTLDDTQARLTIANVADQPGIASSIFQAVARAEIFVDMIVQSAGHDGRANLSITVPTRQEAQCRALLEGIAASRNCGPVSSSLHVAKLSILGIGMRSHTEVAIRAFECLARLGINIAMINTSEVRLNIVVDGAKGHEALAGLRAAFADAM